MKKISIIVSGLILISCVQQDSLVEDLPSRNYVIRSEIVSQDTPIHQGSTQDATHPKWITYVDDIDGFLVAYPADYPEKNPIFMSGLSMERVSPARACTPYFLGILESKNLMEDLEQAVWGKVDFFEKIYTGDFPPDFADLCRPPVNGTAYVLCSEKDTKTVVICVSQGKDNPDLAKQIFETFRWTE
jgi:hypothetical protein